MGLFNLGGESYGVLDKRTHFSYRVIITRAVTARYRRSFSRPKNQKKPDCQQLERPSFAATKRLVAAFLFLGSGAGCMAPSEIRGYPRIKSAHPKSARTKTTVSVKTQTPHQTRRRGCETESRSAKQSAKAAARVAPVASRQPITTSR